MSVVLREGIPYSALRYDVRTVLSQNTTLFTLPNSKTYTPGKSELLVFVDGMAQEPGVDYTEVNSTQIEFSYTVETGQAVRIRI